MFSASRRFCFVTLLLLGGCNRSNCCHQVSEEEKPAEKADKDEVKALGPNSMPMLGGTVHRNLANTVEKDVPTTWNVNKGKEVNLKWSQELGDHSYSGIVVSGGRIFVGTNNTNPRDKAITGDKGVLMCFRESDGKFLWQIVHDKQTNQEIDAEKVGVFSTPLVEGDKLYYVSNRCELVCAATAGDPKEPGKGKILWKLDMVDELKVYPGGTSGSVPGSSPLILGDLVYVLTSNGSTNGVPKIPSPKAPSLIAVNKNTGKLVWSDNSPGDRIMDGQWSSPVAAEANGETLVIYGGGDGWLYAFEAKKGELRWKFDLNPKSSFYKAGGRGNRGYVVSTPVVYDKKLYVTVGSNPEDGDGVGRMWCIDPAKKPANKDKDVSPYSDPTVVNFVDAFTIIFDPNPKFDPNDPRNKDSALVWHYGGLIEPKPERSRELIFGRSMSTPAIHDGLVYAAEIGGFLNCLDANTGKPYWKHDLQDSIWNSPYYVDGKVYLGTQGSKMNIFQAGKTLKPPTVIEMNHALDVPPTAVNGVLYITDAEHLYAIAPKK